MTFHAFAPKTFQSFAPSPNGPQTLLGAHVYIVDADEQVRQELTALVERSGCRAESFATAGSFLNRSGAPGPCCLILELNPPDLGGLEVLERLANERAGMPVIFITDQCDLRLTVRAIKAGAIELLLKPVDPDALLEAVRSASEASKAALAQAAVTRALQARYATLSCREREVMALIVTGLMNKQVGARLGISEITVKAHRGQAMRKMQARTIVDLVHMSGQLQAPGPAPFWRAL